MQIEFSPEVALQLEAITVQTEGMEFSGFGFVEIRGQTFFVYEFVLLDVGSRGWTEIPGAKLAALIERPDSSRMKLWIHRHPVGNGIPGRHNWSGTDEHTCRYEPLGVPQGMQDSVKWALAAVRTPRGWVGRYDTYGEKGTTVHIPVVPALAQEVEPLIAGIYDEKNRKRMETLRQAALVVEWGEGWDQDDIDTWLTEVSPEDLEAMEEEELGMFQAMFWGED